jgi:guanosine-3',5'-bis(diphosphate) 3'-pyrophosphohydrolase
MDDLALILGAAAFAAEKHQDQRRKNGDVPYINHPLAVARSLVEEAGVRDPVVLAAAILHDTLEDTDTTGQELERAFGAAVAGIVRDVTDDHRLPKAERKQRQVAHARELGTAARLVKLADKLHNLRDLAQAPPPTWDAARVQGYFCWAHEVVQALGPVNEPLWRALAAQFAAQLRVGGTEFRAVPEDPAARRRVLEQYYRQMERARD